jgi:hypothetical protein
MSDWTINVELKRVPVNFIENNPTGQLPVNHPIEVER